MIRIMFNACLAVMGGLILISAFSAPSTDKSYASHKIDIPAKIIEIEVLYSDIDLFCLAKNIFHEAGIEPDIGKYAVAQVTLNRVRNPKYPNSICKVVLQRYQFSWANQKSKHWTRPKGTNWDRSYTVAKSVLDGEHWITGLDHVQYYHADYVYPKWAKEMTEVTQIGRHKFYTHY